MGLFLNELLVVAQFGTAWHSLLCGTATDFEDLIASLSLLPSFEKHLSGDEFCKYARHGPDVDTKVIIAEAQQ